MHIMNLNSLYVLHYDSRLSPHVLWFYILKLY
nr:MAG TPA: hypothetical protein [Caudoviricetes sp.]